MNYYLEKDMGYYQNSDSSWLNAIDAHKLACESCEVKNKQQMNEIMARIKDYANNGEIKMYQENLRMSVKMMLEDLGYKITKDKKDENCWIIEW